MEPHEPRLVMTCFACPEQYEVFLGDTQIGYLRLRHGEFRAEYPDCGGDTVFRGSPKGDGRFEDDEREQFLSQALDALLVRHRARG